MAPLAKKVPDPCARFTIRVFIALSNRKESSAMKPSCKGYVV